ncbi:MAG: undecaprenyl-diphosphate phosphatase [Hyphomicrobiaceae bacterium]|nr:MAG: undecaprenyl-diphosphate phosphatase [Hyphomicrobiaceae bacterium]
MNNYVLAVVIGVIEGLTEFLPVSSTAHILLAGKLLGFKEFSGKTFEIMIQLGAILALCVLYFRRIWSTVVGLPNDPQARRFALLILIAFMPAAVIGASFNKYITGSKDQPGLLGSDKLMPVIAIAFIVGGLIMLIVELTRKTVVHRYVEDVPYWKALAIGFCQAVAMIPGVSRSGATIVGGMAFGLDRRAAAELSFYVAIPTMLGAFVFSAWKSRHELSFDDASLIAVGFSAAFLAALLVVRPFLAIISRAGFTPFALYRVLLGSLILGILYL